MEENNVRPQDLWEPAKPGEKLEDVWIPNRKQRRWMKRKKNQRKAENVFCIFQNKCRKNQKQNGECTCYIVKNFLWIFYFIENIFYK